MSIGKLKRGVLARLGDQLVPGGSPLTLGNGVENTTIMKVSALDGFSSISSGGVSVAFQPKEQSKSMPHEGDVVLEVSIASN